MSSSATVMPAGTTRRVTDAPSGASFVGRGEHRLGSSEVRRSSLTVSVTVPLMERKVMVLLVTTEQAFLSRPPGRAGPGTWGRQVFAGAGFEEVSRPPSGGGHADRLRTAKRCALTDVTDVIGAVPRRRVDKPTLVPSDPLVGSPWALMAARSSP